MINAEQIPSKNIYRYILLALFTAAVFFFIVKSFKIDLRQALQLDPYYLSLAVLITISIPFLNSLRWKYILDGMGIAITFHRAFQIILGTWLMTVLPGRMGDFSRALALPENAPKELGFGSVLFEKLVDIFILLVISVIGLLIVGKEQFAAILIGVLIIGVLIMGLLRHIMRLSPERIRSKLENLYQVSQRIALHPGRITKICAVSAVNWLVLMTQVYLLFRATGVSVPFLAISALMPLSIFAGLLPITLAGMGTRDSAMIALFRGFAEPSQSLAVGIWYSLLGVWLFALVGLPFVRSLFKGKDHT